MTDRAFTYRTHTCGELRLSDIGQTVVLMGWVHRVRDLGGVSFIDLRDRHGLTQVVVRTGSPVAEVAARVRPEYVVAVAGAVAAREGAAVNDKLPTGHIEVVADGLDVLNTARTPPFAINDDSPVSEDTRLRYRYLDLRRPALQQNLVLRHRVALAARRYFDAEGFIEIETPILTRSTPEGARDYLVPSRVHPGEFFALPQSPQIFKQILMIAGMDRYVQIVRCFRDEDLRSDRQPEFTQIDVEMSFATEELVYGVVEGAVAAMFAEAGHEVARPFPRLSYTDALLRYGSDKPDLRPGMAIADLGDRAAGSAFAVFAEAIAGGGAVRGLVVPGGASYSRKDLDGLAEQARTHGAGGLIWVRVTGGTLQSPALKAAGESTLRAMFDRAGGADGALLLIAAGATTVVERTLGHIRLAVAKREGLLRDDDFRFAWVTGFPLFAWSEDEGRWEAMHHPFTAPATADLARLESDPGSVSARAYDLALNGSEIAGGSIRIHQADVQRTVFRLLGISDEQAKARFGFFLDALEYGTPPHGGIAFGLDRIIAVLCGAASIREVIAFPKTAQAVDLMAGAPSTVDARQLEDLHIRIRE
ncbi:MAG TPA: aspartate--tRNA ligase [Vicinamibacterales bacterium]|nr:aspartate--tRNA ligase [Vicinamibacterales bacterium]